MYSLSFFFGPKKKDLFQKLHIINWWSDFDVVGLFGKLNTSTLQEKIEKNIFTYKIMIPDTKCVVNGCREHNQKIGFFKNSTEITRDAILLSLDFLESWWIVLSRKNSRKIFSLMKSQFPALLIALREWVSNPFRDDFPKTPQKLGEELWCSNRLFPGAHGWY